MKKKWIVVAESSRARIFSVESRSEPLKEVSDLVNEASRQHGSFLHSDNLGRTFDSNGAGGRHAMEPRLEPKKVETLHFAHDVCDKLEQARKTGQCNDLVIISSPSFLGLMKQTLGAVTQKHITKTISKNLIHKSEAEIRNYVFS
jgi:protein required for attachment to host cells